MKEEGIEGIKEYISGKTIQGKVKNRPWLQLGTCLRCPELSLALANDL